MRKLRLAGAMALMLLGSCMLALSKDDSAPAAEAAQAVAPASYPNAAGHKHAKYVVILYNADGSTNAVWHPDCSVWYEGPGYVFNVGGGKVRISGTIVVKPEAMP